MLVTDETYCVLISLFNFSQVDFKLKALCSYLINSFFLPCYLLSYFVKFELVILGEFGFFAEASCDVSQLLILLADELLEVGYLFS